jgi:hypothetical protein
MDGNLDRLAWRWLMFLPRIDDIFKQDQQIIIRACPRLDGSCKPFIKVTVAYPGLNKRVRATGNSLYEAVEEISRELWRHKYYLPPICIGSSGNDYYYLEHSFDWDKWNAHLVDMGIIQAE